MISKPLKIGVVAEGPTDFQILQKIVEQIIYDRDPSLDFILESLQPELDENQRAKTGGWGGVYRWSREKVDRSESAGQDFLLADFFMLIIQLDADVADKTYQSANVQDNPYDDLPCALSCPPASDTTDALRKVLLRWINEDSLPGNFVLCTPSKSLESWLVVALYPQDRTLKSSCGDFECRASTEKILKGKPKEGRLMSGDGKNLDMYKKRAEEFKSQWSRVCEVCTEARRFANDVNRIRIDRR